MPDSMIATNDWHESSMPSTIAEHLSSRGIALQLRALVAAVCAQRTLSSHVRDCVAISPSSGGHIVGYLYPQVLSLAMAPARANRVGAEQEWTVEPGSDVNSYRHVPAEALDSGSRREAVLELFLQAVDWRAAGPYSPAEVAGGCSVPAPPVAPCPIHFTEMPGGSCYLCD